MQRSCGVAQAASKTKIGIRTRMRQGYPTGDVSAMDLAGRRVAEACDPCRAGARVRTWLRIPKPGPTQADPRGNCGTPRPRGPRPQATKAPPDRPELQRRGS